MALGDSVAELREITPGELTPVAPACKLSGTPAAGSPPIFTDIWHKAAMLKGKKKMGVIMIIGIIRELPYSLDSIKRTVHLAFLGHLFLDIQYF